MADDAAADDSEAPAPAEEEETPAEEPATADEASPPEVEAESPAADAADGPDDASPVAEEDAGAEPEAEAAEDTPAAGEGCHRFERHLSAVVLGGRQTFDLVAGLIVRILDSGQGLGLLCLQTPTWHVLVPTKHSRLYAWSSNRNGAQFFVFERKEPFQ